MNDSQHETTFEDLCQRIDALLVYAERMQQFLRDNRPASIPSVIFEGVESMAVQLPKIKKKAGLLAAEQNRLHALAGIGQVVNSSLELDVVLEMVMDTIIGLLGAERGFLMLKNEAGSLTMQVARNWERETLEASEFEISHTIIQRVEAEGRAVLTTNAQEDPRFTGQQSVMAYNLRSILAVPMNVKNELIGVIYADNRIRSGLFTQKERDILEAFANQAAVAIENARLFESVRRTLAEVTELKNLMDQVFASITSGVLTADVQERILLCNRAAERIMGIAVQEMIGMNLGELFAPMNLCLDDPLIQVLKEDKMVVGLETSSDLPERGRVDLRMSFSPLKDFHETTRGVAIVVEDLTEKKRLESQRQLFERMVSPRVIEQLDPNRLRLGGQKAEITTLFADIRGFTQFSESVDAQELVAVLNQYLAAAAEAVLCEEGTVDKFLGDGVMAWFNAPIAQADHTLRALRAALGIREGIKRLHANMPHEQWLGFGIGIHVGEAVLGLVGTEQRLDYTAIGDSVNTAKRIQEYASLGQILVSQDVYERVSGSVEARPLEAVLLKGKRDPLWVYEITGLC